MRAVFQRNAVFVCSGAGDVGIWLPDDGIRVPPGACFYKGDHRTDVRDKASCDRAVVIRVCRNVGQAGAHSVTQQPQFIIGDGWCRSPAPRRGGFAARTVAFRRELRLQTGRADEQDIFGKPVFRQIQQRCITGSENVMFGNVRAQARELRKIVCFAFGGIVR